MTSASLITLFKKQRILILLTASMAISIITLIILSSVDVKRNFSRKLVLHTYEVLLHTERIVSCLKDSEAGQRGYLLTGERSYLQPYERSIKQTNEVLSALENLTLDNPQQQERMYVLSSLIRQNQEDLQRTIKLRSRDSTGLKEAIEVVRSGKSKVLMDSIRNVIKVITDTEKELLEIRSGELAEAQQQATLALWGNTLFSLTILVMGIRNIIGQLRLREKLYHDMEAKNRELLFHAGKERDHIDEHTVVRNLMDNLNNAIIFIRNIGAKKYDEPYKGLSSTNEHLNKNNLAGALLEMRDQLMIIDEEERTRRWSTEGLAEFAVLLRSKTNQVSELYSQLTSQLVKYVKANQAGLFILQGEPESDRYFELVACYAYDRKKYMDKRVAMDEGLIGQAFLEKEIIHLTHIPKDYVRITSGLGEATPSSLLLVPLKVNEMIVGVLEIASLKNFLPYEIAFLKKLAESIAATLSGIQGSERTRRLLEASQQQAEELKAAEEEMHQNMEELAAAQEEMMRSKANTEKLLVEQQDQLISMKEKEQELQQLNEKMEKIREQERERAKTQIDSQKEMIARLLTKQKKDETGFRDRISELESKLIQNN